MLLFYRIRNPFSCFLRTIKAIWFQKIIYTVQNLRQGAGADGLLKSKIFLSDNCKYSYEPVISCLEAVAFFRVSKLIRCPYQRQCNLARDRNPAKGKPLLRQGTDGNRSLEGDISLNSLTKAPVVFLAFAVGETASPERSAGECRGGKTPPCQRP